MTFNQHDCAGYIHHCQFTWEPKTLTIDVEQHNNQLDPFVQGLLDLLQQQAKETERADFRAAAQF